MTFSQSDACCTLTRDCRVNSGGQILRPKTFIKVHKLVLQIRNTGNFRIRPFFNFGDPQARKSISVPKNPDPRGSPEIFPTITNPESLSPRHQSHGIQVISERFKGRLFGMRALLIRILIPDPRFSESIPNPGHLNLGPS